MKSSWGENLLISIAIAKGKRRLQSIKNEETDVSHSKEHNFRLEDEDIEEVSDKEFKIIVIKLFINIEKQKQTFSEFKEYVTQEVETLKQNWSVLLEVKNSLAQI